MSPTHRPSLSPSLAHQVDAPLASSFDERSPLGAEWPLRVRAAVAKLHADYLSGGLRAAIGDGVTRAPDTAPDCARGLVDVRLLLETQASPLPSASFAWATDLRIHL